MSDTLTPPAAQGRPGGRWLAWALIASLAVNLLFIGAAAARFYVGMGPERSARLTQMQLIPRHFFGDLDRARRLELMKALRARDGEIRDGRQAVRAQVAALAEALDAEPYDAARVRAVVEGFTSKSEALFLTGAGAALNVIEQLTPEERKLMAAHLRARSTRGRPGQGGGD